MIMAANSGRKRGEVVEVTLVGGDLVDLTITEYKWAKRLSCVHLMERLRFIQPAPLTLLHA